MRWWRTDPGDDGIDDELVQRRLVQVFGGAGPALVSAGPTSVAAGPTSVAAGPTSVAAGPAILDATPELAEPAVPPADSGAARVVLAAFDPGRRAVKVLAVVALAVAVLVAGLVWWSRPRASPVSVAPRTADAPAGTGTSSSSDTLVVAVAGRVQRPGLVRLPPGARVADAIEAAGGVLPGTDLAYVNLARKVVDGELVLVGVGPAPGAGGPPAGAPGAAGGAVNLNTATTAQLDALPGVGPVMAQRIIEYRTRHGGFRSVDELRKVDGFGDAKYAQLKELVTV